MTRIESELHDLHECLMRNDDMADRDTYHTIVGIANDVAEVEAENVRLRYKVHVLEGGNRGLQILNNSFKANNAELRDFVYDMWNDMNVYYTQHESPDSSDMDFYRDRMRELGVEVDGR